MRFNQAYVNLNFQRETFEIFKKCSALRRHEFRKANRPRHGNLPKRLDFLIKFRFNLFSITIFENVNNQCFGKKADGKDLQT